MAPCRICRSPLEVFLPLGKMPLANGFLTALDFSKEYFFNLEAAVCPSCWMVQLVEQPEPSKMFHAAYPFATSSSSRMQRHFNAMAEDLIQTLALNSQSFAVELGCNDGTFLRNFAQKGIPHLGIDPADDLLALAAAKGVQTRRGFFSAGLAEEISQTHGKADLISTANTLCHIDSILDIFEGFQILLKPEGTIVFEEPYLGDGLSKISYDQIYDEHVFLFSLHSLQALAARFGFHVIGAEKQWPHGGCMRYFLSRTKRAEPHVKELLAQEKQLGFENLRTYFNFSDKCRQSRENLTGLLGKIKKEGKRVMGYGATSKSTTVINYCGLTPDLIESICDTTPAKHDKYSPGAHIPIVRHDVFKQSPPDYALLFAWNHAEEIRQKEQAYQEAGGRWIVYVPEVQVLDESLVL